LIKAYSKLFSDPAYANTKNLLLQNFTPKNKNISADINTKDNKGRTALMYAVENGHTDIVKLLKAHGAKEYFSTKETAAYPLLIL